MLKSSLNVIGASSLALSSMFIRRSGLSARSWRAEFTCRFVQKLLEQSRKHPSQWLRDRQNLLAMRGPALKKVESSKLVIAGVPCIQCVPKNAENEPLPLIIYFHGGGYVVGSAKTYHYTIAKLAHLCRARIIAVDYRLAPEFPLPAAQEDCLNVVDAMLEAASPQDQVFLAGDSAGGGLVLNTLRELKEQGRSGAIDAALLISPWVRPFDPECLNTEYEAHDILSEAQTECWVDCFGDNYSDSVRVSDFSETSFIDFPPMYVQAAGKELFLNQINDLVRRMRSDGVATAYDVFPDMFHVFQTLSPLVPEADRALALIAKRMERLPK